jgi:hypothetical protein
MGAAAHTAKRAPFCRPFDRRSGSPLFGMMDARPESGVGAWRSTASHVARNCQPVRRSARRAAPGSRSRRAIHPAPFAAPNAARTIFPTVRSVRAAVNQCRATPIRGGRRRGLARPWAKQRSQAGDWARRAWQWSRGWVEAKAHQSHRRPAPRRPHLLVLLGPEPYPRQGPALRRYRHQAQARRPRRRRPRPRSRESRHRRAPWGRAPGRCSLLPLPVRLGHRPHNRQHRQARSHRYPPRSLRGLAVQRLRRALDRPPQRLQLGSHRHQPGRCRRPALRQDPGPRRARFRPPRFLPQRRQDRLQRRRRPASRARNLHRRRARRLHPQERDRAGLEAPRRRQSVGRPSVRFRVRPGRCLLRNRRAVGPAWVRPVRQAVAPRVQPQEE